ncbi:hypothetical protein AADR41_21765 [Streptomyces sp. CLV115]|uniref:hypothetical protein n=1 Tax=Streptomyces sp. CLV115 TaxID=3138502 RepID=UPI00313CE47D
MDHGRHRAPAGYETGGGCPTTPIGIPVRIVVRAVVLPVRRPGTPWWWRPGRRPDSVAPAGPRADRLYESVLTPAGREIADALGIA